MGYKSLSTPPVLVVLLLFRQWPPSGGPIVEYYFEGTERFLSAIGPPEGGHCLASSLDARSRPVRTCLLNT